MQTLALQRRFAKLAEQGSGPVSYGPCQFPTLGFVVARYEQVQAFVPEAFWFVYLALARPRLRESGDDDDGKAKDGDKVFKGGRGGRKGGRGGKEGSGEEETTEFTWRRVRLFDFGVSLALYEHVLSNPLARVTKKSSKGTKKWYRALIYLL